MRLLTRQNLIYFFVIDVISLLVSRGFVAFFGIIDYLITAIIAFFMKYLALVVLFAGNSLPALLA
jgi:hypothetical protein